MKTSHLVASSLLEGEVFGVHFADTGGPANPTGILSPEFLALKVAVDRDEEPRIILARLMRWLETKNIPRSKVQDLLKLEPAAALQELVNLVKAGWRTERLPAAFLDTLRGLLRYFAAQEVEDERGKLQTRMGELDDIVRRFQ